MTLQRTKRASGQGSSVSISGIAISYYTFLVGVYIVYNRWTLYYANGLSCEACVCRNVSAFC